MREPDSEIMTLGQTLTNELRGYARRADVVVLALTPGVVPLADDVARALRAPLDLFLVRPLVLSESGRLEIGAVASGGVLVVNPEVVRAHAIPAATIASAAQAAARALALRDQQYRGERQPLDLRHRKVIVVDDGSASLATLRVAVAALRRRWVQRVVLASPTMPEGTCRALLAEVDEIVASLTPEPAVASHA